MIYDYSFVHGNRRCKWLPLWPLKCGHCSEAILVISGGDDHCFSRYSHASVCNDYNYKDYWGEGMLAW